MMTYFRYVNLTLIIRLDVLNDKTLAANRHVMRNFYSPLKNSLIFHKFPAKSLEMLIKSNIFAGKLWRWVTLSSQC